ncbi:hypothetical protein OIU80_17025 [Flavobacterium sp. LS1R47]|uniref:Uncharacterized protein n=1 Tax=Flavobacterium frigoritolerans TaxID=2987686 RepID=A0A9X3C9D1_9FLAO|nr:hypothetical protein [Flavobacterium frigoritolerans]MCV9933987.1 hypothetical protein [Flavobacterium frigoritolerans]
MTTIKNYQEVVKKSRIYVDFNEMIDFDLVLLSQKDKKLNSVGVEVELREGMEIAIYMDDEQPNGFKDNLIASGIVERNHSNLFEIAKWCCRIDENGIQHESDEIEKKLKSKDATIVINTLLETTFHNQNWEWVQDLCIELLENKNPDISGLAVTCLGHIARIHRVIDKEKVLKAFESRKDDEAINGRIEDAIEDINVFVTGKK